MSKVTRFVGLDVHAETIVVAVAEGRGQVRSMGTVENRAEAVERVLRKVGKPQELEYQPDQSSKTAHLAR